MRWCSLFAVAAGLVVVPFVVAARDERAEVFAVSSLVTVRERGTPRGAKAARLEAARGEWESFQVVVRAGAAALRAVEVTATPLVGAGGARIDGVRVYRVGFVALKTPSNVEGAAGMWPDALIPAVDAYVGERRNAFPHEVPARGDLTAWIDVFVPPGAPPGRYAGEVRVRDGKEALATVPVELEVRPFTLPATSSLPVTYGFASRTAALGHLGRAPGASDARLVAELGRRYALAALRHRVSVHGMSFDPPEFATDAAGRVRLDTRAYDAEVGPFLDGRADPGGPADGARWSAVELRVPGRLAGAARDGYVRELVRHLDERGWLSRAFDYTADEPPEAELPNVRLRAMALRKATPRVPRLVTRPLTAALDGAVDLWCPTVNQLDDKPDGGKAPPRSAYEARLGRGERLWWYQSCMSHGCDVVGDRYFTGWPSLVIDSPAVGQRIQQWLTFRYRVGGELYFNTVEAYVTRDGRPGDPWRDVSRHGGNGDGTLFYPGRPDVIGGRTHVPVESIRLKRVRDGLEDYEYLRLYAARAGFEAADALARRVAERTHRWDHDPEHLLAVRHELAAGIAAGEVKAAAITPAR